jgi:hypothetical protein
VSRTERDGGSAAGKEFGQVHADNTNTSDRSTREYVDPGMCIVRSPREAYKVTDNHANATCLELAITMGERVLFD